MTYGFARCHHCNKEFAPEHPGDVLCPRCQKDEDAQYAECVLLDERDRRPAYYSREAMRERLGVSGNVDE